MHRNNPCVPVGVPNKSMIQSVGKGRSSATSSWSRAVFSRPASACPYDSMSQGVFLFSERSKNDAFEIYLPRLRDALGL